MITSIPRFQSALNLCKNGILIRTTFNCFSKCWLILFIITKEKDQRNGAVEKQVLMLQSVQQYTTLNTTVGVFSEGVIYEVR
jgi:hypothetical protein